MVLKQFGTTWLLYTISFSLKNHSILLEKNKTNRKWHFLQKNKYTNIGNPLFNVCLTDKLLYSIDNTNILGCSKALSLPAVDSPQHAVEAHLCCCCDGCCYWSNNACWRSSCWSTAAVGGNRIWQQRLLPAQQLPPVCRQQAWHMAPGRRIHHLEWHC